MEFLATGVFSPYFDQVKEVIEGSETLTKSRQGMVDQAAHASAGSIIGGIVGGPFGAMVGGIAGALIGFVNASSYSTVFFILSKMAADERRDVISKVQALASLNVRDAVTNSVTSAKDSVTSFVSKKSQAVTKTVTGSVVSVTGSVMAAPANVASYMYQTTCNVTKATTNVMTSVVTQNFAVQYIRGMAYTYPDTKSI